MSDLPRHDQIIVWIEQDDQPIVLAIFDAIREPSALTQRDTYRGFVERFGPHAAEAAIHAFRQQQSER